MFKSIAKVVCLLLIAAPVVHAATEEDKLIVQRGAKNAIAVDSGSERGTKAFVEAMQSGGLSPLLRAAGGLKYCGLSALAATLTPKIQALRDKVNEKKPVNQSFEDSMVASLERASASKTYQDMSVGFILGYIVALDERVKAHAKDGDGGAYKSQLCAAYPRLADKTISEQ